MLVNLKTTFSEEGSGAIGFSITGLNDEAVTPNTFLWTLTDNSGTVINSRSDVSETPAETIWVLLQGADLAVSSTQNESRIITVKGTLNTILGGIVRSGIPYTGEYRFDVCNYLNIP